MNKIMILSVLAVSLCGCYGYSTTRTIKPTGNECAYNVNKSGNMIVGYSETPTSNQRRAEKDCNEWLKK